ncbi:MAG: hypothetical protein H7641_05130 [Candidatus Heimdallarchaeota archaeon]|nr:hypothetical protein [Candidatus Heimdallarchaeota archaeon]MCK4876944.1 hypothetical protein [Candidatus Heimdallarchaeota archaeon]
MALIWGNNEESRKISKQSFEDKVLQLLEDHDCININYLFKLIKHSSNLLHEYQRIAVGLENLIEEGKITVDEANNLSLTKITVLEQDELKDQSAWEIERREKEIQKKKEIIRRYSEINSLL